MTSQPSAEAFRPYLLQGERLLWLGKPKQGLMLTGRDAFLIPFSLFWCGFVIFWNVGVWTFPDTGSDVDWFMRLWGIPFLLIGLYLLIGRFIHDAAVRKHLSYAVSDQRILVLRGSRSAKLKSLDIHRLPMLELNESSDGSGTIAFDSVSDTMFGWYGHHGWSWWVPSLSPGIQFLRIQEPRSVYDLIQRQSRS